MEGTAVIAKALNGIELVSRLDSKSLCMNYSILVCTPVIDIIYFPDLSIYTLRT